MKLGEIPDDVIAPVLAKVGIKWTPTLRRLLVTFAPQLANAEVGQLAEGFSQLMTDPLLGPKIQQIVAPAEEAVQLLQCENCGWMMAPHLGA